MKNKITFSLLSCILVAGLFQACENDVDSDSLTNTEFHKKAQLTNIYDNEISPLSSNFTEQTLLLQIALQEYETSPNSENLSVAQEQWKSVQLVWKQLELYDLGGVADSFISFEKIVACFPIVNSNKICSHFIFKSNDSFSMNFIFNLMDIFVIEMYAQ